jgi:hypothetical protein
MSLTTGCQGHTKSGQPCQAPALRGSPYCYTHDPTKAAERCQAHSRGGKARHGRNIGPMALDAGAPRPVVTVNSIEGIQALIAKAASDALRMEPSLARARTLGYLCGVAISVMETCELEQRIAALESTLIKL